jgi:hypothetical protein
MGIGDFCQKQTKGFWLQKIFPHFTEPFPIHEEISEEALAILRQPFYFLKKGQQCFVFLSEDKKYVLKFLRWDKLEPSIWNKYKPSFFPKTSSLEKQKKLSHDFTSYQIALDDLSSEIGLIHFQHHSHKPSPLNIEIYDSIGIQHFVPTSSTAFILQKKAENFFPILQEKIAEGKAQKLKPFLQKFATILKSRMLKGIFDSDISLEHNMGVLEDSPILFDIGNLTKKSHNTPITQLLLCESMLQQARLVLDSLDRLQPELANFLREEIQKISDEPL